MACETVEWKENHTKRTTQAIFNEPYCEYQKMQFKNIFLTSLDRACTNGLTMEIPVKTLFKEVALEVGFKRKANYFYRSHKELQHVMGLRKSRWGDFYTIWLAVSIAAISELEYPPIHKCHVQCNAEDFMDNKNELAAALNEEDYWKTDADTRRDVIKLAVTSSLFYFFNKTETLDELKNYIIDGKQPMLIVNGNANEVLRIGDKRK